MSEPALRLVTNDGEVVEAADVQEWRERCEAAQALARQRDTEKKAMAKRIQQLENKVRDYEGEFADSAVRRPGATEIRDILLHCHEVTGRTKAKVVPDSPGWKCVERQRKHFDVHELKAVPHGAVKTPWFKAAHWRLAPKELYRDSDRVQELSDLGLGVVHQTLPNGLSLPSWLERTLVAMRPQDFDALDRCDCGRLRFRHPAKGCDGFDDSCSRAVEWVTQRKEDRENGRDISEVAAASVRLSEDRRQELTRRGMESYWAEETSPREQA